MKQTQTTFFSQITILLLVMMMLFSSLTGCGKSTYRDDVTPEALSGVIEPLIANASHLDTPDEDYLRFNLAGTEAASARLVRMSVSGQSLDEYGIFRAASADDAAALAEACRSYLIRRNDAWMHTYMVEEYPKLRDAEVYIYGNYVVYLILDEAEKDTVTAAIEAELKS